MYWAGSAPRATDATYTFWYWVASIPRSFFSVRLPAAANWATAPKGVALEDCPPVLE